jgi:hypothetical protein
MFRITTTTLRSHDHYLGETSDTRIYRQFISLSATQPCELLYAQPRALLTHKLRLAKQQRTIELSTLTDGDAKRVASQPSEHTSSSSSTTIKPLRIDNIVVPDHVWMMPFSSTEVRDGFFGDASIGIISCEWLHDRPCTLSTKSYQYDHQGGNNGIQHYWLFPSRDNDYSYWINQIYFGLRKRLPKVLHQLIFEYFDD